MGAMASQITSLTSVYTTVYSGADQRKHQSSTSLAFLIGMHRWPVNSPHKGPVTRKMFPFDDVVSWHATTLRSECHSITMTPTNMHPIPWPLVCKISIFGYYFKWFIRCNGNLVDMELNVKCTCPMSKLYCQNICILYMIYVYFEYVHIMYISCRHWASSDPMANRLPVRWLKITYFKNMVLALYKEGIYALPLVPHICVSESGQHWLR